MPPGDAIYLPRSLNVICHPSYFLQSFRNTMDNKRSNSIGNITQKRVKTTTFQFLFWPILHLFPLNQKSAKRSPASHATSRAHQTWQDMHCHLTIKQHFPASLKELTMALSAGLWKIRKTWLLALLGMVWVFLILREREKNVGRSDIQYRTKLKHGNNQEVSNKSLFWRGHS